MADTVTSLRSEVDDLTKTLNRVVSLITSNLAVNLDPKGELQMTDGEYNAHMQKLQDICDEHDKEQAVVDSTVEMSPEQLERVIDGIESNHLRNALSGLGGQGNG